jgi:hypothetical protein
MPELLTSASHVKMKTWKKVVLWLVASEVVVSVFMIAKEMWGVRDLLPSLGI